jgi:hypothetical protein
MCLGSRAQNHTDDGLRKVVQSPEQTQTNTQQSLLLFPFRVSNQLSLQKIFFTVHLGRCAQLYQDKHGLRPCSLVPR